MKDKYSEQIRLEEVASWFSPGAGFQGKLTCYSAKTLSQFFHEDKALEVGRADGTMTIFLAKHFKSVVAIDGSLKYVNEARKKVGENVTFHVTLLEDFETSQRFDTIICAHVLEHVVDPVLFLNKARS